MNSKKFNPQKLEKLNNPKRLDYLPPQIIAEKINANHITVIIDLGAGTGLYSKAFSDIYQCHIYACDIAQEMIDWMDKHVTPEYKNIQTLLVEENNVPLKGKVADVLCMINVHHELNNPEIALKECHRLLKTGGKIVLSDWKKTEADIGPSVSIRVDEKIVEKQLQLVGFKNIEIYNDFEYNYVIIAIK